MLGVRGHGGTLESCLLQVVLKSPSQLKRMKILTDHVLKPNLKYDIFRTKAARLEYVLSPKMIILTGQ